MEIYEYLVAIALLVLLFIGIIGIKRKAIEAFIKKVNSGKKIVYCRQGQWGKILIDDKGKEIEIANLPTLIVMDIRLVNDKGCYRAVIDNWRFQYLGLIVCIRPLDNVSDKWRIVETSSIGGRITCSHPIMGYVTLYRMDISSYKVGDMITLRTKLRHSSYSLRPDDYFLEYEIIN